MSAEQLDGWKEISTYLRCSVKTAQRLEMQHGLPIHRLPHSRSSRAPRRSPVHAFPQELDQWRQKHRNCNAFSHNSEGIPSSTSACLAAPETFFIADPFDSKPSRDQKKISISALIKLTAAILLVASFPVLHFYRSMRETGTAQPAFAHLDGDRLIASDSQGQLLWEVNLPAPPAEFGPTHLSALQVVDIDGNGSNEVLAAISHPGEEFAPSSSLLCFSQSGVLGWRFTPGLNSPSFGNTRKFRICAFSAAGRLANGQRFVSISSNRTSDEMALVSILSWEGRLIGEYLHRGAVSSHLEIDLDGDDIDELVLGGFDAAADLAFVAALPVGALAAIGSSGKEPLMLAGTSELAYRLIPSTHVSHLMNETASVFSIRKAGKGQLLIELSYATKNLASLERIYLLDLSLKPLHLLFPDSLAAIYKKLELEGRILDPRSNEDIDSLMQFIAP